jgi:hypothetical protein
VLERGLEFDYARPAEKPDCRWRERSERERRLTRVAQDAERALRAVEKSAGRLGDAGVTDAAGLLRKLIDQDFDVDEAGSRGCITARGPTGSCRVSTPRCATDARARRLALTANKLHAAATNSPAPLPTAVPSRRPTSKTARRPRR